MRPSARSFFLDQDMEEEHVGMEVDDVDHFGDPFDKPPVLLDAVDFFNSFEDDFDDSDTA